MKYSSPLQLFCFLFAFTGTSLSSPFNPRGNLESQPQPQATVKNGTLEGFYQPEFEQEIFYGVPFAAPPVGPLRLERPETYNETWTGVKDATARSLSCPGQGPFSAGLDPGEDCLTLDIVRPSSQSMGDIDGEDLPVLVWIYGGGLFVFSTLFVPRSKLGLICTITGFSAGGSADPKYNTSYIVQNSVDIQKPVIVVSINYRVSGFGFLASKEVVEAGVANLGLFDQRLALRWVKENIKAFGGDPSKITIWGESAGGFSVGYHMVAFDGEHDDLFRAGILESGTALHSDGMNAQDSRPDLAMLVFP